ncbi:unnamed protein product [Mytilus coruscus]|uniref:ZMYM2-like/QRICH1 C-terminal domain-containing protein n=1 Tax=Mytilus coruscus TaxID=42192 RepID=A0A6J8EGK1_MYTCO|nr:unnamed protein product [Mytilus coruscus]
MEEIPVFELDKFLARFFMTKSDGTPYEPGTVKAFQSSISRYLTDKLNISIIKDKEFNHSRELLSAKMKELKTMGLGAKKKERSEPFTTDEINLLYEKVQLGRGKPDALIHTVWLNNSLHFGLRSREEHTTLRWGDIERKATLSGNKYLEHTERQTKTRTGATTDKRPFQAKMFEDKGTYMGYLSHDHAYILEFSFKKETDQNNNIDDMTSDDDDQLLLASQEAELGLVLKDITTYESNDTKKTTELPEIVHENYKDKTIQMFSRAHITGNITINFPA